MGWARRDWGGVGWGERCCIKEVTTQVYNQGRARKWNSKKRQDKKKKTKKDIRPSTPSPKEAED